MLDIKSIRDNIKPYKESYKRMKNKELLTKLDQLVVKDQELRVLQKQLDDLRASRNVLSKEVSALKKAGKSADGVLKKVKALPGKIKKVEETYRALQDEVESYLTELPNVLHPSVPYGKDDSENVEIKVWGKKPKFKFPVKNHVELLEDLGLVDFESSAKASGNGFYYLKGDLALLNQALIHFVIDFMQQKKYEYVEPPLLLRKNVLMGATDAASFADSIYTIEGEDAALIGTSEYSLLAMHKGQVMQNLPKKYFSYTMCFRKEIGSHGINEKGLWRTHQFNKVEQFIFCDKNSSGKMYEELLANTEGIFKKLKLPYRVIEICTGDLARWKHRSADVEVWRPTTNDWGEVASCSNCTDYQARKLQIRYDDKKNGRSIVHTLNNTAMATSRALVAICEHYQQADGNIKVPEVLVQYMRGKKVITKNA